MACTTGQSTGSAGRFPHPCVFGGAIFGIFAGLYYWSPKLTGRMLSEKLGKLHFWLMFIGMNLTFGPMHWLGLQGMVRRTWKYPEEYNFGTWNMVVTVGAFIIATSILVFMVNWIVSKRRGVESGMDPWDARTIEWSIPNPTPEWNFGVNPVVESLDDWWHRKYDEDEQGPPVRRADADETVALYHDQGVNPPAPIHLPTPSYFPFIAGASFLAIAYGVVYHTKGFGLPLLIFGAIVLLSSLIGWSLEPLEEEHEEVHA